MIRNNSLLPIEKGIDVISVDVKRYQAEDKEKPKDKKEPEKGTER